MELKIVRCSEELRRHVGETLSEFHPLSELSSRLDMARVGTVLFKIPGTVSATQSQIDDALFSEDTLSPPALRGVHLGQVYTVVFGQKQALQDFAKHLFERLGSPAGMEFQILDIELHDAHVERPARTLNMNALSQDAAQAKLTELMERRQPFLAVNEDLRSYAFFPRTSVLTILEQDSLSFIDPPGSWLDWLNVGKMDFPADRIVVAGEWVIMSQEAYSYARHLKENLLAENLTRVPDGLLAGVDLCLNEECRSFATPAPVQEPPPLQLDDLSISTILDYVAKATGLRISGQGQLRSAFVALVPLDAGNPASARYQNAIAQVAIPHSLYTQLKMKPIGQRSLRRLSEAWRAYLSYEQLPEADQEINMNNINRALSRLESRHRVRPISSPPAFTASLANLPVTSASSAPAPRREQRVLGEKQIEKWAERYADALMDKLKGSTPDLEKTAVILDIDPSRTYGTPQFREATFSRMNTDASYFDFKSAYTLADLNLELALHAPSTLKSAAEQVLDSHRDEVPAFEQLINLIFSSTSSLIVNRLENLLSFPREHQSVVLTELGKKRLTLIYDSHAARGTIDVVLRQVSWNLVWQNFNFDESTNVLPLPTQAETTDGFALNYDEAAQRALKDLAEANTSRYRRTLTALQMLANDPMYPGLNSIGLGGDTARGYGPNAFRSKINQGPNAWRIIWRYEGGSERKIRILDIVDHSIFD